jgi:hypothetical protein
MNPYTSYYIRQAQTGISGSQYPSQNGKGLGNWLTSAFKYIYPYIKSGFNAVTDELLSTGVGLVSDKIKNVPFKESLSSRVKNLGTGLTDRAVNQIQSMTGAGRIKRKRKAATTHSTSKRRRANNTKKIPAKKRKKTAKQITKKKKKSKKKPKIRTAIKKKTKCDFTDIFG